MKKKFLASILVLCIITFSFAGCGKEATEKTSQESVTTEKTSQESVTTEENKTVTSAKDSTSLICSGCEKENICGIYTVGDQEYNVCYDCSNEFISHHKEVADKNICSACEEEKICGTYIIDGQEYIVCPDDFEEFAHGMNLSQNAN